MDAASRPKDDGVEERVESLLARMTLEEKVGQMVNTSDAGLKDVEAIRSGGVGSIIVSSTAWAGHQSQPSPVVEVLNGAQRIAVEKSRLGIPLLFARDVIHGFRTIFPIPLGQAATWRPDLVERGSEVAAAEASAVGLHWTFAPMVDIARDPRWGRIAEGYGEDPYLSSVMSAASVRGFQGPGLGTPGRLTACAKHFAAYGAAEGGRDYNTVDVSERTLRDVYLPSFLAAVRAGVGTLMASFNEISGIPSTANRWLMTDVLRGEWGFDGAVVSDWHGVRELIDHGIARDRRDAARLAALAGVDIDMCAKDFALYLPDLVRDGEVPEAVVTEAARRVLRLKFRMGLFERPYADPQRSRNILHCDDHVRAARETAAASLVLLRNADALLPLPKNIGTLLVAGPLADCRSELFGTWTLNAVASDVTTVTEAIREAVSPETKVLAAGPLADELGVLARRADAIVLVVGEHPDRSGEAHNVATLDLPAGQNELVRAARDTGKPLVLVVVAGRPLGIEWAAEHVSAILWAFHPGGEGGRAIADVLFGDVNPGGRLPVTMPRRVGQVPLYYNHKATGRPPNVSPYASHYDDGPREPLFPFGYGLSYTTFAYADLEVAPGEMSMDGRVTVSARVENTGPRTGDEVVQLYVRDLVGSVTRPVRELKGFRRIQIEPGRSERVTFTLTAADLAFCRADMTWGAEPGEFEVFIGPNAAEGLRGWLVCRAYS